MQKTIVSPPKAPSLKELMDEELARKIQNEESKKHSAPIRNPIDIDIEVYEEDDFDFTAFVENTETDLSEDLMLALQLQEAEYIAQQHKYDVEDIKQSPNSKYEKVVMSSSSDVYRQYYGEEYGLASAQTPTKEFDSDFVRSKGVNVPTVKPNSANKTHGRQSTPSKRNRSTSKKTASNNSAERALNNGNQSPTKLSGFDQVADVEAQHSEDKNDSIVDLTTNEIDDVSPTKAKASSGASNKKLKRMEKQEVIRVTSEGVLDGRTRLILYRLRNADMLRELHGCVSEGKEAKVYHAVAGDYQEWETPYEEGGEVAIKIFKTTLNEFRDREQYIAGDRRFNGKMKRLNPRKMIKVWAEKEMRNLKRLKQCGINAPTPLALRKHVLVMSFLGKDGWPAPQLAQAKLDDTKLRVIYLQVVMMMRRMFQMCELVHADLSEYNILIWKNEPYILDVAQAVEHHHPNAVTFLKRDCLNITKFFHRKGLYNCMTTKELFQFVTDASIPVGGEEQYLTNLQEKKDKESQDGNESVISPEDEVEERLFMQMYIPRTLSEVRDPDQEIQDLMDGKALHSIYHHTITGLNQTDLSGIMPNEDDLSDEDSDSDEEDLDDVEINIII
jgi:RIO kinase 1